MPQGQDLPASPIHDDEKPNEQDDLLLDTESDRKMESATEDEQIMSLCSRRSLDLIYNATSIDDLNQDPRVTIDLVRQFFKCYEYVLRKLSFKDVLSHSLTSTHSTDRYFKCELNWKPIKLKEQKFPSCGRVWPRVRMVKSDGLYGGNIYLVHLHCDTFFSRIVHPNLLEMEDDLNGDQASPTGKNSKGSDGDQNNTRWPKTESYKYETNDIRNLTSRVDRHEIKTPLIQIKVNFTTYDRDLALLRYLYRIYPDNEIFLTEPGFPLEVIVHSPYKMPGTENNQVIKVRRDRHYEVKFHNTFMIRLEKPRRKGCLSYAEQAHMVKPPAPLASFEVCRNLKEIDYLRKKYQCYASRLNIPDRLFVANVTICPDRINNALGEYVDMSEECHYDCQEIFYDYKNDETRLAGKANWSLIEIFHSELPETRFTHHPQMKLIEFISNLGGLMGIWLGLSVLAIFRHLIRSIKFVFAKVTWLKRKILICEDGNEEQIHPEMGHEDPKLVGHGADAAVKKKAAVIRISPNQMGLLPQVHGLGFTYGKPNNNQLSNDVQPIDKLQKVMAGVALFR
jgi:Amiloride-sensitive sodium channel